MRKMHDEPSLSVLQQQGNSKTEETQQDTQKNDFKRVQNEKYEIKTKCYII